MQALITKENVNSGGKMVRTSPEPELPVMRSDIFAGGTWIEEG